MIKQQNGRRNRSQIQARLPLPEPPTQEPAIGEVLALLAGAGARLRWPGPDQAEATAAERACTHPPQTPGAGQPGPASSGHRPLDGPRRRRPGPSLSAIGCQLLSNYDRCPVYGGPMM